MLILSQSDQATSSITRGQPLAAMCTVFAACPELCDVAPAPLIPLPNGSASGAAVETGEGGVRLPQELDTKKEELELGRAGLLCANPQCWYLVHTKKIMGGFCCKKCHWHFATNAKSKKKHGVQCQHVDAPEGAPRAEPTPPDDPLHGAQAALNTAVAGAPGSASSRWKASTSVVAEGAAQAAPGGASGDWTWTDAEPLPAPAAGARSTHEAASPQLPASLIGRSVEIRGFITHAIFNGLKATVERKTQDGRFYLRLADGTLLKFVKRCHFEPWPDVE